MPFYYELKRGSPSDIRSAERLLALRAQLDSEVPQRTLNDTLLLATWNIREFDSAAYGDRIPEAMYYIAEVVSRFDIVAVQEVREDLKALDGLCRILGRWWKYVVTDVTKGLPGNRERMAFLFDSRKVRFGGLAGEIVIPPKKIGKKKYQPAQQLYRTPFVAGFHVGWFKFMLTTVHMIYGAKVANDPTRIKEIELVSKFLADRVDKGKPWANNLILLGDFNIFKRADKTYKALESAGFTIPPQLAEVPASNVGKQKRHYDQIAFLFRQQPNLVPKSAGVFDFYNTVFREQDMGIYATTIGDALNKTKKGKTRSASQKKTYYKTYWRTHQMSDHLPMWVELPIDFGKEYLTGIARSA